MKKLVTILFLAVATVWSASAQQKGDSYLGLNLGYNTSTSMLTTTTTTDIYGSSNTQKSSVRTLGGDNLNVGVEYGYFVANNLRVGAHLQYGYVAGGEDTQHALAIAPNVAYYVKLANGFYYTPNLSVGFGCTIIPGEGDMSDFTMCGFVGELQAFAVEFRPTEHFAMSVSLCSLQYGYLSGKDRVEGEYVDVSSSTKYSSSSFAFDLLANAQIGFKYYF
jgi:hypothetical protein